ncbi:prepilin-type N-terminal cleavage/methylation domain-containing protein [Paraneptunicella aestuarii]|uniref:prepilin-type N-terminal cleavage/methylation domain-containing protein n=1 Tax=Paraneptunicella aestuarii TaxID=2831148 RepID=UPI001E3A456A|nr:prepilin-type N-terminal cleavage/methylation domain-containing protein [Paraneptunicella aestuarii]UAA39653.1 prepilin-type N-terminal cleavage/methylation domain-containing protein [Paraneptunicella aestuarii]
MNTPIYPGSKCTKGFTLIELLLAMVLMSIVMGLATMSLSQFNQYSVKTGIGFEARLNRYFNIERLAGLLNATSDYYVADNLGRNELYFWGRSDSIQFVSASSWEEEKQGSLNILSVEQDKDSLLALVLYQRGAREQIFFESSHFPKKEDLKGILILSGASKITFEYLGVQNIRQLYPSGVTENYQANLMWQNNYEGMKTGYLPEKIRISIEWPDGTEWPCIFEVKSQNYMKRDLMLDGLT